MVPVTVLRKSTTTYQFNRSPFALLRFDSIRRSRYSHRLYRWLPILLAYGTICAQTPDNAFPHNAETITAGYTVFRVYCSPCHGTHAKGGRGPDLTRGIYQSGEKDSDLFRTIATGIPGTDMTGFSSDINDDDIRRIVVYIRSVSTHNPTTVPGDRANGENIFWAKGGCGACHVVEGRGGHMGPELTRIGVQRTLEFLREALLDPSKEILPGWATITVTRRDGTKLTGVERGFDNFSAQLMDVAGNYYSFFRSDVASIEREERSLMPDDYGRRLKPAEVDDLLAFLVSLRGAEKVQ